jgi:hypothetical protein
MVTVGVGVLAVCPLEWLLLVCCAGLPFEEVCAVPVPPLPPLAPPPGGWEVVVVALLLDVAGGAAAPGWALLQAVRPRLAPASTASTDSLCKVPSRIVTTRSVVSRRSCLRVSGRAPGTPVVPFRAVLGAKAAQQEFPRWSDR